MLVVAPSLIPRKPGDRVKTNRRDAAALAKLLRADELTPVWVPDKGHEAIRDLIRARAAAVETLRVHRQQVSAFMLKQTIVHAPPAACPECVGKLRALGEDKSEVLEYVSGYFKVIEPVRPKVCAALARRSIRPPPRSANRARPARSPIS